jgi:hypothetical protein
MVKKCNCKHAGQDALHGEGMRVFNETMKVISPQVCTVCGGNGKSPEAPVAKK